MSGEEHQVQEEMQDSVENSGETAGVPLGDLNLEDMVSPEELQELTKESGPTGSSGSTESSETISSPSLNEADYQAKLAAKDAELQQLKAQLDDRSGQYMRIAADFDNFRKRTQREKEEMEQQIKCSTLVELLPVVDNFERARSQIKPQTEQETTIHKSYQSVYKQLVDCLKRVGVSPMRAEGKEFDPALHEAVMRQPTSEHPEGTVIEELQRGYLLGERVLRHALVKVAAPDESAMTSDDSISDNSEG